MSDYLHGAYGEINTIGNRESEDSLGAMIYIGTAPVHTIEGGGGNVNKPILVRNIAEAKKYFGYSDNWEDYTLCEAMHVHFNIAGVGPLVMINVLDPAVHKDGEATVTSKTPSGGMIVITSAEDVILDSITVKTTASPAVAKVKGTDYSVAYDAEKKQITIKELTTGALGSAALTVTYDTIDPSAVDNAAVIGNTDGAGLNKGTFAIADVYQVTGYIPSYVVCPGFSAIPAVHEALHANCLKVNGHWDVYMFTDLPILNGGTAVTLDTVATFKAANSYNYENETVHYPLVDGIDGKKYHLSVLRAANFQGLLLQQDGIPYRSASNTECALIENLYLGESYAGRIVNDSIVNEKLNKNGIASAAFVGGHWVIWGAHSADYDQTNGNQINVSETNRLMLYYISNDFQARRSRDVDQPLTMNDIRTIVSEEQARLDALVNIGALIFGEVTLNASEDLRSDMLNGDWSLSFRVTTTPLAKSLTAVVTWVDDGFVTYFEEEAA